MVGKKPEEPPETTPELQDLIDTSVKYNDRNVDNIHVASSCKRPIK